MYTITGKVYLYEYIADDEDERKVASDDEF